MSKRESLERATHLDLSPAGEQDALTSGKASNKATPAATSAMRADRFGPIRPERRRAGTGGGRHLRRRSRSASSTFGSSGSATAVRVQKTGRHALAPGASDNPTTPPKSLVWCSRPAVGAQGTVGYLASAMRCWRRLLTRPVLKAWRFCGCLVGSRQDHCGPSARCA